ncbi:MAG: hypothetical protein G01um101438_644 [Parcubacteria group bacterium Gr01-1014_38]|nr:MAG: hypothetical protein G01um101438_644 [Parcubacteria group bacterium Gr01-1014_38]
MAAQKVAPAVYFVGSKKAGVGGTAVCIHVQARLLATAAHVADLRILHGELYAMRNGFGDPWRRVVQVWYPFELPRHTADLKTIWGLAPVKDSVYNRVSAPYRDVAVLQLEDYASAMPILPAEIPLASKDQLFLGRSVGLLGFPTYGLKHPWPHPGDPLVAIFDQGFVKRETGHDLARGVSAVLDYSIGCYPGNSGAPLFTSDGFLVAIHSGNRMSHFGSGPSVWELWRCIEQHEDLRRLFAEKNRVSRK